MTVFCGRERMYTGCSLGGKGKASQHSKITSFMLGKYRLSISDLLSHITIATLFWKLKYFMNELSVHKIQSPSENRKKSYYLFILFYSSFHFCLFLSVTYTYLPSNYRKKSHAGRVLE